MKKFLMVVSGFLFIAALSGCKGVESCPAADPVPGTEMDNMITSDMLGQGVYAALQADWDAWNAKDDMQKMISSHMPGFCYKRFDTQTECEEFLGFEIFNPLEDSEFEKGTYVGMPEGYNEAPRFYVSFHGTNEGKVDWISVESGYRDSDIRITVNMSIRPDKPLEINGEQMITEDSGERYVATSKMVAIGPASYNIRVVGEENQWEEVRATLKKVLLYFEDKE